MLCMYCKFTIQQPSLSGIQSEILTVWQTLKHLSINLLKTGAWIYFQMLLSLQKQYGKSEFSIHNIAVVARGCSQESNSVVLQAHHALCKSVCPTELTL